MDNRLRTDQTTPDPRRALMDRRSGDDDRKVYSIDYFLNGGVERRSGTDRRKGSERRRRVSSKA